MALLYNLRVTRCVEKFKRISSTTDLKIVKAKVYVVAKQFDGFPKLGDLVLKEEELPPINDGEFLVEAIYLSVDPYMRLFNLPLGSTFFGSQVAKIIESKSPKFAVGQYIVGYLGWRTHTISNDTILNIDPNTVGDNIRLLSDFQGLPRSLGLGILGMPGNTAYFGFLEVTKPKAGETVVVSGAAGAVGSIVGQLAKIKGCKVIGIAGSDDKGKWLTDELGFDHFINYKTQNVEQELSKAAPNGVDIYFDNVGGEISTSVLNQMKTFGRISVCGSISGYNDSSAKASIVQLPVVTKQLRMEGFVVKRWIDRWNEGTLNLLSLIKEGKLKYNETITNGFENTFDAFTDMLKGGNTGKAIIQV